MQHGSKSGPEDGSWLSSKGPYRDYIAAWCGLNPNLRSPDSKNKWTPLLNGNARVAMLSFEKGEQVRRSDFLSAADLSAHLKLSSSEVAAGNSPVNRIYIMEGLAPDFIAALGDHFFMSPTFFMGQERTTLWGLSHEGSQQTPCLPSLVDSGKTFLAKYYELRDFDDITTFSLFCSRTSRNISVTRNTRPDLDDRKFEPIGIIHRKCSFWSRKVYKKGYDVVILCDPPVKQACVQTKHPNIDHAIGTKYTTLVLERPPSQKAPNTPFSGGYIDFIKHPEFGTSVPSGPPRTSMLEDLCFYLVQHGSHLEETFGPTAAAIFIQKIVASNYMQLIEFVRANICNLEYQLSRRNNLTSIQIPWIEERWSDLQSWSRRCSEYVEDVEAIMISVGISYSASPVQQNTVTDWISSERDFQYIHYYLKALKAQVEVVSNSITGLAGIAGNQQALMEAKRSLKEAKYIKTLTLLGMVFIPLAFCTGIFSMSDRYLPGTPLFWIYFAVSIPLIVTVFLVAFLIALGYDNEGEWNLKTFFRTLSRTKASL